MLKKLLSSMIIVAVLAVAGSASAATPVIWAYGGVTFDPFTGTGTVPKGDLQSLFGWNNAEYEANVSTLGFRWQGAQGWRGDCRIELARTDDHGLPFTEHRLISWGGPTYPSVASFLATRQVHGHHAKDLALTQDPQAASSNFPFLGAKPVGSACSDVSLIFPNVVSAVYVTEAEQVGFGTLLVNDVPIYRYSVDQ
jgi:hypothetical protein